MIDPETLERIADFFEPWELVEYLGVKHVSTRDIIEAFEDDVLDALSDIEELMEFKHDI
jgi:hypothetical protein